MRKPNIIISSADYERLLRLIDSARLDRRVPVQNIDALEGELARATIVAAAELPPDVVAMNSSVWFHDLDTEEVERYTLVLPADADVIHQRISVLAPIGTALLGYRIGDVVEWRVPLGRRRLQITEVLHANPSRQSQPAEMLV